MKILPIIYSALIMLLCTCSAYGQEQAQQNPIILHHADSLVGREGPSGAERELIGNVYLSQGNVQVRCNKAIQNLSLNTAVLMGNVQIVQGTLTLETESGIYDGNTRIAKGYSDIRITDREVSVRAAAGEYSTQTYIASFFGNVRVQDDSALLFADTVYYERTTQNSRAYGHVIAQGRYSASFAEGDTALNSPAQRLTILTGRPVLFQIDSTWKGSDSILQNARDSMVIPSPVNKMDKGKNKGRMKGGITIAPDTGIQVQKIYVRNVYSYDTMTIMADTLRATRLNGEQYNAEGFTEIIRQSLFALCNSAVYRRENDALDLNGNPRVWYDSTQLSGDSIKLLLLERRPRQIDALGKAFALMSDDTTHKKRVQQLSGHHITINIMQDTIRQINAMQEAKSLYFRVDEQGQPDGAARNTCDSIRVDFELGQPEKIVWTGAVQGDVIPEQIISDKEDDYALPGQPVIRQKPVQPRPGQPRQRRQNHNHTKEAAPGK
jgi:lipopolysaccharide export system protein LptA